MKRMTRLMWIAALALAATACGGGTKSVNNKYLGELPSVILNYQTERDAQDRKYMEKCQAAGESGDHEKAQAIFNEANTADEQLKAAYKADLKRLNGELAGREMPFACEYSALEIREVKFKEVMQNGWINFTGTAVAKEDIADLRLVVRTVGKEGCEIVADRIARNYPSVKAGQEISFSFHWQVKAAGDKWAGLPDFTKFVFAEEK